MNEKRRNSTCKRIGRIFVNLNPFPTEPKIEGYRAHEDVELAKKFPNCCDFHRNVNKVIHDRFERDVSIYIQWYENEFNTKIDKAIYKDTPEKIVKQLSYTEFFISKKISEDLWYKDITKYIEYNIQSFGTPSIGVIWYIDVVKYYLNKDDSKVEKQKKNKIIAFLDSKINSLLQKKNEMDDLNPKRIYTTVQKWLKLLPFKIPELNNISENYQWIVLPGKDDVNPYSGLAEMKTITKPELIELLFKFTKILIRAVDTTYLKKTGTVDDINKHHEALTDFEYKFNREKIVGDYSIEENVYVEILDKWINAEVVYIEKIKALIKNGELILKGNTVSDNLRTFETRYTESELLEMRVKLFAKGCISKISKNDFLYLFQNKPINGSMQKLMWKKKRSTAYDFFKKVIYIDKQFSPSQINECVKFPDGKKMTHGCKSGEYIETNELMP